MKKNFISLIANSVVLLFIVLISYYISKAKFPITGTYKSEKYGYSFQVPESFLVTKEECKKDSWEGMCLEKFTITPKSYSKEDLKYLDLGNITVIKNIKNISTGGQTSGTEFNSKTGKWFDVYSTEEGPLYKEMPTTKMGDNIVNYSTSGGGSHWSGIRYIINNNNLHMAFMLSTSLSERIRCDGIKDTKESISCWNYLKHIKAGEEGWTRNSFYSELFKDKDKILESFEWKTLSKQASPTPTVDISDWKTYTNMKQGISFKYPSKINLKENDKNVYWYDADKKFDTSISWNAFSLKGTLKDEIISGDKCPKNVTNGLLPGPIPNSFRCDFVNSRFTGVDIWFNYGKKVYRADISALNPNVAIPEANINLLNQILSTFRYFGNETIIKLNPREGSSPGVATLIDLENGQTKIVIELEIMAGKPSAAIYSGSCSKTGAIKYNLTNVSNGLKTNSGKGKSETTLNVSLSSLRSQFPLALGVQSIVSPGSLDWCGDL